MEDSTWEQGKLIGVVTLAMGLLKWLVGRSRSASVDEKYDAIKTAFEEHERKMDRALKDIREDLVTIREHQQEADEKASEQRRRVNIALDEMTASLLSFKRVLNGGEPGHPPSRLR